MFDTLAKKFGIERHPRDERIEALMGRAYKAGFHILLFVVLFDVYLQLVASQYATSTEGYAGAAPAPRILELVAVVASTAVMSWMQMKEGVFDGNARYDDCETFPIGYAAAVSGIVASATGVALGGGRFAMELAYEGFENATWAGDIALGAFYALGAFAVSMLAMYLSYRSAARRKRIILEGFDSEADRE